MIYIGTATEDDIPRILEIESESISPPWTHGTLLNELYREDSFFITAVENKMVLGFAILRQAADEGELLQIAVAGTARRRGIAGALMDALLRFAEEASIITIHLEVRRSNSAAIGLYKKYAFKTIRYRKNYYDSPVEDAAVMARSMIK